MEGEKTDSAADAIPGLEKPGDDLLEAVTNYNFWYVFADDKR